MANNPYRSEIEGEDEDDENEVDERGMLSGDVI
jgi:hypothetical protein